ncbi:uncharacterized protein LOC117588547 isoform X1 [Drosophila guanche]|uniref:Uncharacterized protein n=2 Tax=Drosophila guanche TaxID=7266 RepID=A0A3B0JZB3_DROGU|nr:uncharacterized protein LOC117588547 isoform X1 [Drosophila guanche]SPP86413.1 Hypothetical predicted protein [Drosophila guanche]
MLPFYDLWLMNAFDSRMVLQNHNTVVARSTLTPNGSSHNFGSFSGMGRAPLNAGHGTQRPIVDLLVAMVAVPVLILCALQLEKNLRDNSDQSRWLVFALGIGMLVISVIICGYVTHRMGVCIWAGPIDEAGNRATNGAMSHINSQNDVLRIVDTLPPSYESVLKFELPPPSYDCLVIDIDVEQSKDMETPQTSSKSSASRSTSSTEAILHI